MISAAPGVVRACAGPTWMSLLARLAVARLAGFEPATGCLEGGFVQGYEQRFSRSGDRSGCP